MNNYNRRDFVKMAGLGFGGILASSAGAKPIQGFDETYEHKNDKIWTPISDRKIKVGLVGYGQSKFSTGFGFQDHPNVEIAAVSDLIPERCAELSKVAKCSKTYPSLEKMLDDDSIEAVFLCTDAPSHMRHSIMALERGKHVACAVPAIFGDRDNPQDLYDAVKKSGKMYMMFETSMYRKNLYEMKKIFETGAFGKVMYTEGEYWHYLASVAIASYKNWRIGLPPMWYPTHNDAYYIGVTNGSYLEVSAMGILGETPYPKNQYGNPFRTEIAIYKTSLGGIARMGRSDDTVGLGYGDETGRLRGTKGSYYDDYQGNKNLLPDLSMPALPKSMKKKFYSTWHGGSHAYLTEEFISAILQKRKPLVDVAMALNMTVGGITAHASAMKDGETLKVPQFKYWA